MLIIRGRRGNIDGSVCRHFSSTVSPFVEKMSIAKSLKVLTVENAILRATIENTKTSAHDKSKENETSPTNNVFHNNKSNMQTSKTYDSISKKQQNGSAGIGLPRKGFQRKLPLMIRGKVGEKAGGINVYSISHITLL